jgi:hypothetical protein
LSCPQLLEAALCLALQQQELDSSKDVVKGGVLTPASGGPAGRLGFCCKWRKLMYTVFMLSYLPATCRLNSAPDAHRAVQPWEWSWWIG